MPAHPMPRRTAVLALLRRASGWNATIRAVEHMSGIARRRDLEAQLADASAEIQELRAALAEATRPPTLFARMRMHERAVDRFARLRRATPRRLRGSTMAERERDFSR
jgi:hypothetical protein